MTRAGPVGRTDLKSWAFHPCHIVENPLLVSASFDWLEDVLSHERGRLWRPLCPLDVHSNYFRNRTSLFLGSGAGDNSHAFSSNVEVSVFSE